MKYNKEERPEVGCKIHESGLTNLQATEIFGIGEESVRHYRILITQFTRGATNQIVC